MNDTIPPRRVIKDFPLTRLLPNMLTILSLCSGLTGIRFALSEKWHEAVLAIVAAGIFDMLDGRVARLLNLTSKFGAELDSLSDAISLGVSPAFIMYEWTLKDAGSIGWVSVLTYVVCMALRLAQFNTMMDDPATPVRKNYFVGMAAPGGAGLAITPIFFVLAFGDSFRLSPPVVAVWMILLGGLMVSRLPTPSIKGIRITHSLVVPIFLVVVVMTAALITDPWVTLSGVGTLYFFSMPCLWFIHYRQRNTKEIPHA